MAVIKISWTVDDLASVLALFDVQKVYRSATEGGVYSEVTTPATRVPLAVGVTDYDFDDTAGDPSYWYRVAYFNTTELTESSMSDPVRGTGAGRYVTVAEMRAGGLPEADYSDADVLAAILRAEAAVEHFTGRWFYPRELTLRVDGSDSRILRLGPPIIQIDAISFLSIPGDGGELLASGVDVGAVRVYNRHLTQGLTTPDDRDAPRLVFESSFGGLGRYALPKWYKGRQNVQLEGVFGYTVLGFDDPVGYDDGVLQTPLSQGRAPLDLVQAIRRLAVREVIPVADTDALDDYVRRFGVTRMKTRDQEIQWAATAAHRSASGFTGDPVIDDVLVGYKRSAQAQIV